MCLIIAKKAGDILDRDSLYKNIERAYMTNSDGLGYAILSGGQLSFRRGLFSDKQVISMLDKEVIGVDDAFAIHLRMATKGKVNITNCHPYPVFSPQEYKESGNIGKERATLKKMGILMHNGVFHHKWDPKDADFSDTFIVTRDFVARYHLLENEEGEKAIQKYCRYNKILTMHPERGMKLYGPFSQDAKTKLIFSSGHCVATRDEIRLQDGKPKVTSLVKAFD